MSSRKHEGFLYAAAYSNGQMKFGVSGCSPKGRLRAHDDLMGLLGASRVRTYVSERTALPYRVEASVVSMFEKHAIRGKEWLDAQVFDAVVAHIKMSLLDLDCSELVQAKKVADDATRQMISDFCSRPNAVPARVRMAFDFASAIELCAKQSGYDGKLMAPSLEDASVSKLYEYVARYAYAHRAEDVASVVCMAATDHKAMEAHLEECIGLLNVHIGVMEAATKVAQRNAIYPRAA